MLENIQSWTTNILEAHIHSPLLLFAILILGFTAAIGSCCNIGVMGAVAGYSGSQSKNMQGNSFLSAALFFTLGNIISLSIIGALTGFVSQSVGTTIGAYWKIIGGLVAVYFGLSALGWLPFKIPQPAILRSRQPEGPGKVNGLIFGLALGGFATACSACCNPIFPVVLGVSYLQGEVLWSWLILLVFAIGYSIPLGGMMMGLGFGFNKISETLLTYSDAIKYVSGGALILIGFGLLLGAL